MHPIKKGQKVENLVICSGLSVVTGQVICIMAIRPLGQLLATIVFLAYLQASMASSLRCSSLCEILHPQRKFCDDDAVMKVKITSRVFVDADNEAVVHAKSNFVRYGGSVITTLKDSTFAKDGDDIFFYSPSYTCSIPTPDIEDIYVIGGKIIDGLLVVSSCDGIAMKFDDITEDQRIGFLGRYKDQCGFCTIQGAGTTKYIGGVEAELGQESGYWSTEMCFFNPIPSERYGGKDCETLYSFCKPRSDTGECAWEATMDYDDCFENRESVWFFTEKGQAAYTCRSQCANAKTKLLRWKCVKATKKLEKQGYAPC